jgi:iron uptake system component EfeO
MKRLSSPLVLVLVSLLGCSSSSPPPTAAPPVGTGDAGPPGDGGQPSAKSDAQFKQEAVQAIHDTYASDLTDLVKYSKELQAAAPTPAGRGWDATLDATAIAAMRDAWRKCRIAYEHVEGAIAPILPDIDVAIDARYDDFLTTLGGKGDDDLFDGEGVTGMHAVERILFAPLIPARTIDFEKTLVGYKAAAFPSNEAEAASFKNKLLKRLVDDVTVLESEWQPAKIDPGVAWSGLISLMNEQAEKVNKASTGEEESRYAQMTLFDLRNNLDGTRRAYAAFEPWLLARDGKAADDAVLAGFQTLADLYGSYTGDAVPAPPATWSSVKPTDADLATPFGRLFTTVTKAVDPNAQSSVVSGMNAAARIFGFPEFKAGR